MPRASVVIEISSTRFEAIRLGRPASHLVVALDGAAPDDLASILDAAAARLKHWVASTGSAGAQATVFYRSSDAFVGAVNCPKKAGARGIASAVRLALTDSVAFPLDRNPWAVHNLWADRNAPTPSVHVLAVADNDENATRIAEWITSAGLTPSRIVPADATLLAMAVRDATSSNHATTLLTLRLGEHSLGLVASTGRTIHFIRCLGIGAESLVNAYRGSTWSNVADTRRAESDASRSMLYRHGVPDRDAVLDEAAAITGIDVLPRLQPVLQRIGVEVKQSIRFGLSEPQRDNLSLQVTGFGAAIPRLAEVLAAQAGLRAIESHEHASASPTSMTHGPIAGRDSIPPAVNLLPVSIAAANGARRVKQAVWCGAAIAAAIILGNYVLTQQAIDSRTRSLDSLLLAAESNKAAELEEQVRRAADGVVMAEQLLTKSLGESPDFGAVLTLLADATPDAIRIDEIALADDPRDPASCLIQGRVLAAQDPPATVIKAYVDRLRAAPVVRAVSIGSSDRRDNENADVIAFDLRLELVRVPALAFLSHHDGAPER